MIKITQPKLLLNVFGRYFSKMSSPDKSVLTPVGVRGMTLLDRDKFARNIKVPYLKLTKDNLHKISKLCKPYALKLPNFKCFSDLEPTDSEKFIKCIYLNPDIVKKWSDISEEDREALDSCGVNEVNFDTKGVELRYENWPSDIIFRAILPEDCENITGFSQIGHIIHLNLKDYALEYRKLIGEVFLDKIKTCRTVITKTDIIDNSFRNFSMEVIAGEKDFVVTMKENRVTFQFDFSKVYWNPRLGKEHERILEFLHEGDVLFDVFCGVGPFAIPAAKRGIKVFANDLNPESFKWLNHNAKLNKVKKESLETFNQDGKDFICDVFKNFIMNCKLDSNVKIHITMNLPALAHEFLQHFRGLISSQKLETFCTNKILIYLYCFVNSDNSKKAAQDLVNEAFGMDISKYVHNVFNVRNVAPNKEMMRVTIELAKDILFYEQNGDVNSEPPIKKLCIEKV